jgi:hypothetical protein
LKVYKAILDATQEVQQYLRYHSGKYFIMQPKIFIWPIIIPIP